MRPLQTVADDLEAMLVAAAGVDLEVIGRRDRRVWAGQYPGELEDAHVVKEERAIVVLGMRERGGTYPERVAVEEVAAGFVAGLLGWEVEVAVLIEGQRPPVPVVVVLIHAEPDVVAAGAVAAFSGEAVVLGRRRHAVETDRERAVAGRHDDRPAQQRSRAAEPAAWLFRAVGRRQRVRDVEDELADHRMFAGVGHPTFRNSSGGCNRERKKRGKSRSEEHTSELQSQSNLVCRLLLEK